MHATPYVCILVAFLLIYVPRMFVLRAQILQPDGLDNAYPRAQQAKLTGLALRAQGAHMNGFEAFAPFAAGVLACEMRHVDTGRVDLLSLVFAGARVAYVGLYLGNVPPVRSAVWFVGLFAVVGLMVLAALGG
jgi:uncharacterized MAPEG superfamily protein